MRSSQRIVEKKKIIHRTSQAIMTFVQVLIISEPE